jgi:hypothetical protein
MKSYLSKEKDQLVPDLQSWKPLQKKLEEAVAVDAAVEKRAFVFNIYIYLQMLYLY